MAQQTFSGVPAEFTAGEVLSSSDQNLLRDYLIATIKEGMTGDTGEILPMIMDLTNNRIELDSGGLKFSDGSTQTVAATAGLSWSGSTANGLGTYGSSSSVVAESTATYDGTTLTLTGSGGGLKLDGLNSSNANTLDDYEEGTWTPALAAGSGTITINTSYDSGSYVKIGKMVHVQGLFLVSAISSPSGTLSITGLPFTSSSAGMPETSDYGFNMGNVVNLASAVTGDIVTQLHPNGTAFDMNAGGGATAVSTIANLVDTGTEFYISGVYRADT